MTYGYADPQYAPYAPAPVELPRQSAPPSVHTVAILHYLSGLLQLAAAAALATLAADGVLARQTDLLAPSRAGQLAYLVAGGIALSGLITIVLGRKLQRGRQWARILMIIWTLLGIAGAVLATASTGDVRAAAGLTFPALYLILLNTRAARSWFRWHTW